jgi:hypothetical protein
MEAFHCNHFTLDSRTGESWIRGVIVEKIGPLIYLVDIPGGRLWKRHVDHIKDLHVPLEENETIPRPVPVEVGDTTIPEPEPLEVVPEAVPEPATETVDTGAPATQEVPSSGAAPEHPTPECRTPKAARKKYPSRQRVQPDWYHNQAW